MKQGSQTRSSKLIAELSQSLGEAIGEQTKTYVARVTNTIALARGRVQAHSEILGHVSVICGTADHIEQGDTILIRRSGTQKYLPYVYAGSVAQGQPLLALEIAETDGDPIITGVNRIEFPPGTVTPVSRGVVRIAAGGLSMREIGDDLEAVTILETPVGSLTFPEPGVARLATGGGGGGGISLQWNANGECIVHAFEDMTLELEVYNYGGGSVSWTISGSTVTSPFVLEANERLIGKLQDAQFPVRASAGLKRIA
jgi:hypothetical protein